MKKTMSLSCFFFLVGFAAVCWATPVTFIYESTTNASQVGGSAFESVRLVFTFKSDLSNSDETSYRGSYGPWSGTLYIGSQAVELTGGTIVVFNDAGTTIQEDSFEIRWENNDEAESSGTLFEKDLERFRILLVDEHRDMFSSVALPLDPNFASKADYIQDDYGLSAIYPDEQSPLMFGLSEFGGPGRAFTLSSSSQPVPEPTTIVLFGAGLLGLAGVRRKFRKS